MRKIIALLILLGSITMLSGLWPMPSQLADEYRNEAATTLANLALAEGSSEFKQSSKDFYEEIVNDPDLEIIFWFRWLTQLVLVVSCLVAGWLMFTQRKFWPASVLVATALYGWRTGLFFPLYGILLRDTSSLADISSRLEIVAKNPSFLFNILWFNVVLSCVFMIGAYIAMKSFFVQRESALTHHSSGTPNGAPYVKR